MSDWVVIVSDNTNLYGSKVYGPFKSEDVAQALARGFMQNYAGQSKTAVAVRMESP